MSSKTLGKIFVSSINIKNGKINHNKPANCENILIHTPSTNKWSSLSPYVLKDKFGNLFENIWQASKVYPKVTKQSITLSRFHTTKIWEHDEEQHIDEKTSKSNNKQRAWRKKLLNNKYAVRYPNGFKGRRDTKYSLEYDFENGDYKEDNQLDYITARKKNYVPMYQKYCKDVLEYKKIFRFLKEGRDVNICEVDGPKQDEVEYYSKEYDLPKDFIKNGTVEIDINILNIFLNDNKRSFGHGFTIALCLIEDLKNINYIFN